MKKKYVIGLLWLLVLAVAAMIFIFSSQDGLVSAQTSGEFTDFLIRVFRPDYASLSKAERRAVYRWLSKRLRLPLRKCHISMLGVNDLYRARHILRQEVKKRRKRGMI